MIVKDGNTPRRAKLFDYFLWTIEMAKKVVKRHNVFAQDLRTPKYRKRVVRSKKVYNRKAKHK